MAYSCGRSKERESVLRVSLTTYYHTHPLRELSFPGIFYGESFRPDLTGVRDWLVRVDTKLPSWCLWLLDPFRFAAARSQHS